MICPKCNSLVKEVKYYQWGLKVSWCEGYYLLVNSKEVDKKKVKKVVKAKKPVSKAKKGRGY